MLMKHWTLNDIPWHEFDPAKADPAMVPIVKAASIVEFNGRDYARYLNEVFSDDAAFQKLANDWADEEVQHGEALRKWAELADPTFDFEHSFKRFINGYQQVPKEVNGSVRGSRSGELIARCIVETGTSNYYTAIKERTDEPVLKAIAARIAADELRHYKLFYTALQQYLAKEKLGLLGRLKIAVGRVAESEDDELAYAYYAANAPETETYSLAHYGALYARHAYPLYERKHVDMMAAMLFKAVGLKPHTRVYRLVAAAAWGLISRRIKKLMAMPAPALPQAASLQAAA